MMKTLRKLVVRSETIRTLRVLDDRDLARAVGGSAAQLVESTDVCPGRTAAAATGVCG
jgi:hypothetical protein